MKKSFCEVCKVQTNFKRLEVLAETEIRGTALLVQHEYDECTVCRTSFEPLENINKNILKEYSVYREKVGYLQPDDIINIRESYKLNVREFSGILGLNYQTLVQIEKGSLQNAYQNMLFEYVATPQNLYNWVVKRNGELAIPLIKMEKNHYK